MRLIGTDQFVEPARTARQQRTSEKDDLIGGNRSRADFKRIIKIF